ncbi:MAG: DUF2062 domain-containing protein [Planctomycetota bacterium]|jgi:glycosyltransferase involved in cell wall biosynthesis
MTRGQNGRETRELIAIPTFNNRDTLCQVVKEALNVGLPVLVVDDGSTDGGLKTLESLPVQVVHLPVNQGKGAAISEAARWADSNDFTHIITLDADGQHDPRDVHLFIERIRANPLAIIIGKRDLDSPNVPRPSRFGRAFSNFWLRIACGVSCPDSQSGFRAYPVEILRKVKFFTHRYDFEVEVLVRSVWAGASLDSVDVSVHYDDKTSRASHFRMWWDNTRISLLYARLVARNLVPWPHKVLIEDPASGTNRLSLRDWRRSLLLLLRESTTPRALAAAAMLGIFLGTLPLIACHCVVIVFCATRLRLNRLVALNISHLCAPPFVPALAIEVGFFARNGRWLTEFSVQTLGRELHHRLFDYVLGSLIVGPILALAVGGIVFVQAWLYQRFISRRGVAADG